MILANIEKIIGCTTTKIGATTNLLVVRYKIGKCGGGTTNLLVVRR